LTSLTEISTNSFIATNTPSSTVGGVAGAGGSTRVSGSSSTSSSTGGAGDGDGAAAPVSTPAVVGGVVGGVAGIVFIVALLMVFVRWRKRHQNLLRLGTGDSLVAGTNSTGGAGSTPSGSGAMTERSLPFAIPAALANLTGHKRTSHQHSVTSMAGSEVGFVRVSGRKLPSVFQHGGDGYGDPHDSLGGSSFYRDSDGFYGGPGSPGSPISPNFSRPARDSGVPVNRPSPARTPVISEGAFGPPSPVSDPIPPLRRPDGLGRSHPSRDGSHGSRFQEEV
jgi:hypothetical protein